ncbi:2,5-didehydrogluconate reductase DkgB [Peredibacter starrii]|uniref:2,5-didehydrogluconate reductase DkgB n=1 Tax=Peredibacter starrii TaxID=28202 RepID=A0AAX4HTX0_9BACT|nr:2,5-didehydrogluconate reductase DkgB [Peredibacter starrii]WPU66671.1 2,5-didehydrogluconate reductase DkgB [Peredibacter starrii]
MQMPQIGLGTFRLKGDDAYNSVKTGLEVGYRHIDTAQIYDNEEEVGKALTDSGLPRAEVFVTTKIWNSNLGKENLIPSLMESLRKLQTSYVDLLLIHWPSKEFALKETLDELMKAKAQGLTKEIGISNFPIKETQEAIDLIGANNIYTNQIEIHPFLQNKKLVNFLNEKGIRVTAYMPLAYGKVMTDETLKSVGGIHDASPATVSMSWLLDQGFTVIPSSTKRSNLENNLKTRVKFLTSQDAIKIQSLDRNERLAQPEFSPKWD